MNRVDHPFKNREEAGEFLAQTIQLHKDEKPLVLGLPRGGLPVAAPIADKIDAELDVLLVKKIGAPFHPEVAIGAVSEEGDPIWDSEILPLINLTPEDAKKMAESRQEELRKKRKLWPSRVSLKNLQDRTVILVDDGLATGSTMEMAVKVLKKANPKRIIVAVPVGTSSAIEKIKPHVDEIICPFQPEYFSAVSQGYVDFREVFDDEVTDILAKNKIRNPLVRATIRWAEPLRDSLYDFAKELSQYRVVMLGESTHGTHEFYKFRRVLSEILIAEHGFNFIAVEGDWPDCWSLNEYIEKGTGGSARQIMSQFKRWPTWMWSNTETEKLIEWMRAHGGRFYGLDVYSLFESIDIVKKFAGTFDSELPVKLAHMFSCFEPFDRDEMAYARSLIQYPNGCESEIVSSLREILRLRVKETTLNAPELFHLKQNALIIKSAEKFYRTMMEGGPDSWNARDEHMLDTLDALLSFHGEGAKGIVWAHNTHIGDYHATDMPSSGYINLGGLAREKYGIENVALVGLGAYEGEVLAGRSWGAKAERLTLPKAQDESYEHFFHLAAIERNQRNFLLRFNETNREMFEATHPHRAVGVVYQPEHEARGNYVPTSLARRYDAFVFFDKTIALKPISFRKTPHQIPETWPLGQ